MTKRLIVGISGASGFVYGQRLLQMLPRKRLGKPEDLDALLVMLASGQSNLVNGAILTADDGMSI